MTLSLLLRYWRWEKRACSDSLLQISRRENTGVVLRGAVIFSQLQKAPQYIGIGISSEAM